MREPVVPVPLDFKTAQRFLAGGVDSPVRAGRPVGAPSPFIVSGRGAHVVDAAGRSYIDYLCAYGPVILGHGDRAIAAAVAAAARDGAVVGTTHPEEVRLAQRLCERFDSLERVRFVSTGTEACMSAVRVARSFTGKAKLIRFSGCYHGHSDEMIFSAGASSLSAATLEAGVTQAVASEVIVLPYNDIAAVGAALGAEGDNTAAVIIETICGNMGLCLPETGFLDALRSLTRRHGVLLIFDEVITGFRMRGGAQEALGVSPDLTCLGKALGGGLPIAAFGGSAAVMKSLAPDGPVFVGGTFSGNPVCVAAAHALLDVLDADPRFFTRLERKAKQLAAGLQRIIATAGLTFAVVQWASMVDFMFRPGPAHRNFAEAAEADASAYAAFYRGMLERGILLPPSQMELLFLTAAHSEEDIEDTLRAAEATLASM
ncbi:MAG TPA: glutamate-1-semialdehyde 2,1-aminomutase [Candidatus Acidoferrales bacterium]|nr:glutamate-1-semialdehyde 2,1-aminomutase [Candidatus Acidoferrales bacterium]